MKTFDFYRVSNDGAPIDQMPFESISAMSFKKAVKSFQSKHSNLKQVDVERESKNGEIITTCQKLPMGRKKKLGRWLIYY